jgi:hypothetical protein
VYGARAQALPARQATANARAASLCSVTTANAARLVKHAPLVDRMAEAGTRISELRTLCDPDERLRTSRLPDIRRH